MAVTPLEQLRAQAAKFRCMILDHPEFDAEIKRRLMMAAAILESGNPPHPFDLMGAVPLKEIKRRYIEYMVTKEGGIKAAARALSVDAGVVRRSERTASPPEAGSVPTTSISTTQPPSPKPNLKVVAGGAVTPNRFSGRQGKSLSHKQK